MKAHEIPEAVQARAEQEDPLVMYLIVRESLNMSPGKIGAQCGHAAQMILLEYFKLGADRLRLQEQILSLPCWEVYGTPNHLELIKKSIQMGQKLHIFEDWLNSSFRKVTLRADDKEWSKIKEEITSEDRAIVVDAGLTEIPAGSETVISLWPMLKSQRPKLIKRLQALK